MEGRVLQISIAKSGIVQISKSINHGKEKLDVISFLTNVLFKTMHSLTETENRATIC